jgi:hypothetical protein
MVIGLANRDQWATSKTDRRSAQSR